MRSAELWKRLRAVYYIISLSYVRSDECHRDGLHILRTVFSYDKNLLERLDPVILDVIDNPHKTQKTDYSETSF